MGEELTSSDDELSFSIDEELSSPSEDELAICIEDELPSSSEDELTLSVEEELPDSADEELAGPEEELLCPEMESRQNLDVATEPYVSLQKLLER